jgi:hypothetical protein
MITRRTPITGNGFAKGLRFIESISAAIAQEEREERGAPVPHLLTARDLPAIASIPLE